MGFALVNGDTVNPLIFTANGICSPYGTALHMALSVRIGQRTLGQLIDETADLLIDCDECHTTALACFPNEPPVQELAVQWALISPALSEVIAKIEEMYKQGRTNDEDTGSIAVIYDLLTTRRMTFTINGIL